MSPLCHAKKAWKLNPNDDFSSDVWFNAILSVLAISVAPFAILFFFTLDNSEKNQGILKILLRFGRDLNPLC